ncbi:enoyl-CoA hydratase/isomerase family protein [Nonomuraea ferruginea]
MSDNPVVLVERDGSGIVTVTLDRPDTKNSVPRAGWIELAEVFGDIAGRADDRVVVLTGAGGDFCSGSDLRGGDSADSPRRAMRIVNAALLAVRDLPQPTIAAVSGVAAGGGFNLALACDLAVAEETARFSQIFARRGLSVDFGGTWFLTHMLGAPPCQGTRLLRPDAPRRRRPRPRAAQQGRARGGGPGAGVRVGP